MLKAGRSEPWPDVLEKAIGERDLSAGAVIEFFKPLNDYLEFQLRQNNEPTGWKSTYKTLLIKENASSDNTVPIIVGAVLGAMVIVVIIAYFIGRSRNRKKHDKKQDSSSEESGHDNAIEVSE